MVAGISEGSGLGREGAPLDKGLWCGLHLLSEWLLEPCGAAGLSVGHSHTEVPTEQPGRSPGGGNPSLPGAGPSSGPSRLFFCLVFPPLGEVRPREGSGQVAEGATYWPAQVSPARVGCMVGLTPPHSTQAVTKKGRDGLAQHQGSLKVAWWIVWVCAFDIQGGRF